MHTRSGEINKLRESIHKFNVWNRACHSNSHLVFKDDAGDLIVYAAEVGLGLPPQEFLAACVDYRYARASMHRAWQRPSASETSTC